MLQTLYHIPEQIGPFPVFGFGLLLCVWAIGSVLLLAWLTWRQGFNADTRSYIPILLVIGAIIAWVLPRISEPGSGLPLRGYGIMVVLGVVAGSSLAIRRGRQRGIDAEQILTLIFWGFVPGIICARLFYVVEYWSDFLKPNATDTLVAILSITEGGLVVYGSLIGGLLGFIVYCFREKLPLLLTMDVVAPGMLLGLAFGRVGCFLNGCCFGGPCDLPWAVQFPAGSPPYVHQVHHGLIDPPSPAVVQAGECFVQGLKVTGSPHAPAVVTSVEPGSDAEKRGLAPGQRILKINGNGIANVVEAQRALLATYQEGPWMSVTVAEVPRVIRWRMTGPPVRSLQIHPTQLYSAIDAIALCLFLLAYDPFRRRDGEVIAMLLTLYPVTRFLTELIRTDEPKIWLVGLSIGQVVSLLILSVAAALWIYLWRSSRPPRVAS